MTVLNPLVLDPALSWTIQIDQNVALRVAAPGRARTLYPLSRLGRVVCGRRAQWQTEALVACLEAGVPVLFTDLRGRCVAWCFGQRRREGTLEQLLVEGLSHPEWPSWFDQWRTAFARREMLACLREFGLHSGSLEQASVRARLCNWHRQRLGFGVGPYLHSLEAVTLGVVSQVLGASLSDPTVLGYAREGSNLPRDVATLMQWRIHALLGRMPLGALPSGGRSGSISIPELRVWALTSVEGHGAPLHRAMTELMVDLEIGLRSWLL